MHYGGNEVEGKHTNFVNKQHTDLNEGVSLCQTRYDHSLETSFQASTKLSMTSLAHISSKILTQFQNFPAQKRWSA